jgi:hypothetical protein
MVESNHGVGLTSGAVWGCFHRRPGLSLGMQALGDGRLTPSLGAASKLMSCRYFQAIWERTELDHTEQAFFHGSQLGSRNKSRHGGSPAAEYPRWEFYSTREPERGAPCKCGASSAWRCWNRTRSDELLGGRRR